MFRWVSNRVQWFRCVLNYNNRKHIFERKIFIHYQLWYQKICVLLFALGFAFVPLLYLCAGHRQSFLLYSSYVTWFAAPSITNVHCIICFRVKTTLPCWLKHRSIHTNGRRLQTLLPKMEKYCTVNAEHKEYADSLEKVKMILSGC